MNLLSVIKMTVLVLDPSLVGETYVGRLAMVSS
jgi:hypothetical protein